MWANYILFSFFFSFLLFPPPYILCLVQYEVYWDRTVIILNNISTIHQGQGLNILHSTPAPYIQGIDPAFTNLNFLPSPSICDISTKWTLVILLPKGQNQKPNYTSTGRIRSWLAQCLPNCAYIYVNKNHLTWTHKESLHLLQWTMESSRSLPVSFTIDKYAFVWDDSDEGRTSLLHNFLLH